MKSVSFDLQFSVGPNTGKYGGGEKSGKYFKLKRMEP
jgi:hypothetical protein